MTSGFARWLLQFREGDSYYVGHPFIFISRLEKSRAGNLYYLNYTAFMEGKVDTIQYAMENTVVLREPDRRIDTFSATRFRFTVISELMDSVGKVRVRRGEVEAHKPQIIKPAAYNTVELEGFDERARELLEWMKKTGAEPVFFRYGFQFKRTNVQEEIISDRLEMVKERILEQAHKDDDPMMGVIEGVDDAWEVGLLKFTIDMIEKSQSINQFDFKRRGLL